MFDRIKRWCHKAVHKCVAAQYPKTGETLIFHWEIPWMFSQTFTVCEECKKVKVLSLVSDGTMLGGFNKEEDGKQWSGGCSYAKVPSMREELTFTK